MGRPMKDLNPFGRPSSAPCSRSSSCAAGRRKASHSRRSVRCQTHVHRPINHLNARPDALGDCAEAMIHFGLAFNVCPRSQAWRHPVKRHRFSSIPAVAQRASWNPIAPVVLVSNPHRLRALRRAAGAGRGVPKRQELRRRRTTTGAARLEPPMSDLGLPDPAMARFSEHRLPAFHPYRLPPLLVKIPDDNERPRRYSGNSHQRRKQRRAQRSHR